MEFSKKLHAIRKEKEMSILKFFQKWELILHRMMWPFISLIVLILIAVLYSLLIYFMIPNNSIAEFIMRPSLIVIAILYTALLIRTNAVLPKIKDEKKSIETEDEENISKINITK